MCWPDIHMQICGKILGLVRGSGFFVGEVFLLGTCHVPGKNCQVFILSDDIFTDYCNSAFIVQLLRSFLCILLLWNFIWFGNSIMKFFGKIIFHFNLRYFFPFSTNNSSLLTAKHEWYTYMFKIDPFKAIEFYN